MNGIRRIQSGRAVASPKRIASANNTGRRATARKKTVRSRVPPEMLTVATVYGSESPTPPVDGCRQKPVQ